MRSSMRALGWALLSLAILPAIASAQGVAGNAAKSQFTWKPLMMRNTSAASVAQQLNWAQGGGGAQSGFADSSVFRRGVSATGRDTSIAFSVKDLYFPPHLGPNGSAVAVSDTVMHTPWVSIRVRQDTTSYSWSGATAMDSIYVAAQWSPNGINWISVNGTPTRAFETTNGTADENGITPVLVGPFGEPAAGADVATVYLGCVPALAPVNSSYILNQTLCLCEGFVRFIFVLDGTGQFAPEIGSWQVLND